MSRREDQIHASIVHDIFRHLRGAAKKGSTVIRRNARLKRIMKEIDAEWERRRK